MFYELDIVGRSVVGADARKRIGEEVRRMGWRRILLVSDEYFERNGRVEEIGRYIEKSGEGVCVYVQAAGEPDTEMVEKGLERYREGDCEGVVGLGGGSVIDTAKTIAVMANNEGMVTDFMGAGNVPVSGDGIIAIPTTAGTGSEATNVVVIADRQSKVKMTGRDRAFLPAAAIVDYKLTMSVPPALTAAVGVDALTHAIEAYVSRSANEFTDTLALNAIKLIWRSIRRAYADGDDQEARRDMMTGSFQAGIAFCNSSVALVHSMSEPIGACFHVGHGLSNAMLLPAVTKFSITAAPQRYAAIARCIGAVDDGADEQASCQALVRALYQLNNELGIENPKAFGIDAAAYEQLIEKMSTDAAAAGSTANNPAAATAEDIARIYREIYEKHLP
jgi:alcohol dehydrogenase class IV